MKQSVTNFLDFNGKTLIFLSHEGGYWVALKPICKALGVDYITQFKNVQSNFILGQLMCNYPMRAADGKMRKMACLPEKWVYKWLFSIQSSAPNLIKYKKLCYDVLNDYFHSEITRKELIRSKAIRETTINHIKEKLPVNDLQSLQIAEKELRQIDYKIRKETRIAVDNEKEFFSPFSQFMI